MNLLAIDPGVCSGCALFDNDKLIAFEINEDLLPAVPITVDVLIIEVPRIYRGRKQKGDPNDLIKVAIQCGKYLGSAGHMHVLQVFPHQWKGSVPKKVHNARVLEEVRKRYGQTTRTKVDHACRMAGSKAHNLIDAIGLGLWYLDNHKEEK